jgi:hypothetical protein
MQKSLYSATNERIGDRDKQTIYNLYYVMTKIIATPTANIIIGEVSNWEAGRLFKKKKLVN